MPELRLPWIGPQADGCLVLVLATAASARGDGNLSTEGYAEAERLGSHLAGRCDGLYTAPEAAAVATSGALGTATVLQGFEVPPARSWGGPPAPGRGALPALEDLRRKHPPGSLVTVVLHPEMVAGLTEQLADLPRWRRKLPPPTGCRTVTWRADTGWRVLPGTWLPA